MARVTIEDCLDAIGGHFRVVKVASTRAHQIELGKKPLLGDLSTDKSTVLALREIAEELVTEDILNVSDDFMEGEHKGLGDQIASEDVGQMVADVDNYSDIREHDNPNADDLSEESDQEPGGTAQKPKEAKA